MALADATVRVILDVSRFDRDLQSKVSSSARRAGRTFEREFTKTAGPAGARYARDFRAQAEQNMAGAGQSIGRNLGTSIRRSVVPTGRITGRELGEQVRGGLLTTAQTTGRQYGRGLLSGGITEAGARIGQRFGRAIADNIRLGGGSGARLRRSVEDDAEPSMLAAARTIASRFGTALSTALGSLAPGRLAVLGSAIAGLVTEGVQFAAALAPALQAIGLIPGAVGIAGAAVSTLVVAWQGMGDAFKAAASGDAAKLATALKNVSPAAAAVVTEFSRLVPRLREVRTQVQQAFFAALTGDLTRLGQVLIGPVQRGMTGTSAAAGRMASSLASVVAEARNASVIERVFDATSRIFDRMTGPLQRLTQGMFDWINATLPAFDRLSVSLAEGVNRFSDFLQVSAASGQALTWMDQAVATLSQLWSIARNLTGTLGAIFSAANEAGGGYLNTLDRALAATREFLSTGTGRIALVGIFTGLHDVVSALGAPLRELVIQLGSVAQIAGNMAQSLSSGVTAVIRGIGEGLTNAGPALTRFADAISRLLTSVAPSLGTLGAAFGRLLDAITPLTPLVGLVVRAGIGLINLFSQLPGGILTAVAAFVALRALGVPDLLQAIVTRGQTMFQSFSSGSGILSQLTSTYQANLASLTALRIEQQVSANAMSSGIPAISGFGVAMGGLGDKARAAGGALRTGLSGALSGLMGVMGGPLGIAVTAASVLIGVFAQANEESARKTQEHANYVSELAQSFSKETGAITENTLASIRNKAEKDGLLQQTRDLGIDTATFISAMSGEVNATNATNDALRAKARTMIQNSDAYKTLTAGGTNATQILDALTNAALGNTTQFEQLWKVTASGDVAMTSMSARQREIALSALEGTDGITALAKAVGQSGGDMEAAKRQFTDFQRALRDTVQNTTVFGSALQKMADTAATAEERTRALRDALRALEGGTQTVTEAQVAQYDSLRNINDQVSQIAEQYGKGSDRAKVFGQSLFDANGQINASSKGVSDLTKASRELNDRMADVAEAATDQARRTGDWASAQRTITDAYGANRDALVRLATSMGFSADEAARFADQMLRTPKQVDTTLALVGAPQAIQQIGEVQLLLSKLAPGQPKVIYMKALTEDAQKGLRALGLTVERLPSGEFKVSANTEDALRAIQGLKITTDQTTGVMTLTAETDQARARIGEIGKLLAASATAHVNLDGADAYSTIDGLMVYINQSTGEIRVGAQPKEAQDKTKALTDFINAQPASVKIGADTTPARNGLTGLLNDIINGPQPRLAPGIDPAPAVQGWQDLLLGPLNTPPGTPQITPGVNPGPAQQDMQGLLNGPPSGVPTLIPGVNTGPADKKLDGLTAPLPNGKPVVTPGVDPKAYENWMRQFLGTVLPPGTPTITPGVNPGPAQEGLDGLLGPPPPGFPMITPSANTLPARQQVQGLITQISNSTGTVTVDGNPASAQQRLFALIGQINSSGGNVNVGANTGAGYGAVGGLLGWIRGQGANVNVGAYTGAALAAVMNLVATINRQVATITVRSRNETAIGLAQGAVFAYRSGGFHSLRPMPASRAEIVPPRAMRVIGDRPTGDEAFIPLVNTARSHAIFRVAASRLGYDVAPRNQRPVQTRTTTVEAGAIVVNAPQSDPRLVAREVVNELVREAVI